MAPSIPHSIHVRYITVSIYRKNQQKVNILNIPYMDPMGPVFFLVSDISYHCMWYFVLKPPDGNSNHRLWGFQNQWETKSMRTQWWFQPLWNRQVPKFFSKLNPRTATKNTSTHTIPPLKITLVCKMNFLQLAVPQRTTFQQKIHGKSLTFAATGRGKGRCFSTSISNFRISFSF